MCAPAWCRRFEGTLPEPEIYTRLARALGLLPGDNALAPLREAASHSRVAFAHALRGFMGANPNAAAVGALVLYHTLGHDTARWHRGRSTLWQAAQSCAKRSPEAVRRALGADGATPDEALGDALFDAIVGQRSGAAFTAHSYDDVWSLISHPDRKVQLAIAPMLRMAGAARSRASRRRRRTIRSCSPPASAACSTPTRFSAIRPGGATIPMARCSSTPGTSKRSARATANGSPSLRPRAASSSAARSTTACARASSLCRTATANPIRPATASA